MSSLIEHLYDEGDCLRIRARWEDPDSRATISREVSQQLMHKMDKVIPVDSCSVIELLMLLCLMSTFAYDEQECLTVAILLSQSIRDTHILPMVSVDKGMTLARKTLVSLSLFRPAVEARATRRGAPGPAFYRAASKAEMHRAYYRGLAENHERWEAFLPEVVV